MERLSYVLVAPVLIALNTIMKSKQKNGKKLTLFVDTDVRDVARKLAEAERKSVSTLFEELVIGAFEKKHGVKPMIRPPCAADE